VRIIICILLALLVGCSSSKKTAEPKKPSFPTEVRFGLDWLCAQNPRYNLGDALELLPPGKHAIRTLDLTCGDSMEPIDMILNSGKVDIYGTALINTTAANNELCEEHEYCAKHNSVAAFNKAIENHDPRIMQMFRERSKLYCDRIDAHPNILFLISYGLEHQFTEAAYLTLNHIFRMEVCPGRDFLVVNNPLNSYASFPHWDLYEQHHHSFNPAAVINSLDGEDIDQIDTGVWRQNIANSNVRLAFGWAWKYNCRVPGPFVNPLHRTDCPTREEHNHIMHRTFSGTLPTPQPPPTSANEGWGNQNLWKPVSESDGNLVALIRNHYREEFDSCKVPLKSGGWETLRFAGRTNPDRLTYRGARKCGQYKERRVLCTRGGFELNISGGINACQRGG
jgi:hypothetical protein